MEQEIIKNETIRGEAECMTAFDGDSKQNKRTVCCNHCGQKLSENQVFCPQCGTKIVRTCPNCGAEIKLQQRFCANCGSNLTVETEPEENHDNKQNNNEKNKEALDSSIVSLEEIVDDSDVNKDIIKKRRNVGFKFALLLAFIAFFFPFCTVSCANQKVLTPSGYELAGDWGMTSDQMQTFGVGIGDMANVCIIIVILLMVVAFLSSKRAGVNSIQMIIASGILFLFKFDLNSRSKGTSLNVSFQIAYWIALIALLMAATASVWSPSIIRKLEDFILIKKQSLQNDREKLLDRADKYIFRILAITVIFAGISNYSMFGAWSEVFENKRYHQVDTMKENSDNSFYYEPMKDETVAENVETEESSQLNDEETIGETTAGMEESIVDNSKGYILPYSAEQYLTEADLVNLDAITLRLARNEIYARHGRKFTAEDLNEYFSSQPWYNGYLSAEEFDDSVLNEYERANLDLIKTVEAKLSSNNLSEGIRRDNVYADYMVMDGIGCVVVNNEKYYGIENLNRVPEESKGFILGTLARRENAYGSLKYAYVVVAEDRSNGTFFSNEEIELGDYVLVCGAISEYDEYQGTLTFRSDEFFIIPGGNLRGVQ